MERIILLLSVAFITLTGCKSNEKSDVIVVACNLPLTGYIGYYGEKMKNGFELAREDLYVEMQNENIKFKFDYEDNKGEAKEAITILNKQKGLSPDIYMSGITGQTMAIIDQVDKIGIPHFLWSYTPLELDEEENNFRCFVSFGAEAVNYIDFISKLNPAKIAYIHVDNVGSKIQCNDVVIPALKKNNPSLVSYTEAFPASTTNFKDIAIKIKQFNPDVFVVSGYKDHVINIIKSADTYGIDRSKIICSMDILDAIGGVSNDLLEGLRVTAPTFNVPSKQSKFTKDWIKDYKNRYNREPVYAEAYAYDCFLTLYEAAKISRKKNISMKEALYEVEIKGVTGDLKYQSNGEIENNMVVSIFRNGELQIIE